MNQLNVNQLNLKNFNINWFLQNGISIVLNILGAIAIVIIGFWIIKKLVKFTRKRLDSTGFTVSLKKVLGDIISVFLKILVTLIALSTVGVQTASIIALIGGLAVGIGLALQGSFSNFAGGLLILLFKPFKVGDFIESLDKSGTVEEISLLQTTLLTPDMRTVILPNGNVFNNPIINFAKFGVRRVEIQIGIGYEDDFDKAKEVLTKVLENEPLIIQDRKFTIELNDFGDSSINLAMYAYTETKNFLQARWNINRSTKIALDKNGFNIPFPQRDLHIIAKN